MSEAVVTTATVPSTGNSGVKNENTSEVKQSVEVSGGDSFVSFDALEQAGTLTKSKHADKKEQQPTVTKEASKEEKTDKSVKSEEKVAQKTSNAKLYKVKAGDKEVSLASDGVLDIPTKNGETRSVTVQDLINDFHGTSEIHRRLTALDQEKKSYLSEKATVDKFIDQVAKLSKLDDPTDLIGFLVNAAGGDPDRYSDFLLEKLQPKFEEFSQLTPEERKFRSIEKENAALKRRQADQSVKEKDAAILSDIQKKVNHVKQTHNLDDQKFYEIYQELKEAGVPEGDIAPETIANYADEKRLFDHVSQEIASINKEFDGADDLAFEITEQLILGTLDIEDIKDVIRDLAAPTVDANIEDKIKSTQSGTIKSQRAPKNAGSDPINFDDL